MDGLERSGPVRGRPAAERGARCTRISARRSSRRAGNRGPPPPSLVRQIKVHPSYNAAMGEALGIEGSQQAGPDYATLQPYITATISGTHVEIGWNWGGFANFLDQLELEVDRGQGFVLLAIDTT